jgi:GcrA cell cycle regulator
MRLETPWTDDRIAILKQLWVDGASAAMIADHLGISRSAVLGKIFRLRRGDAAPAAPSPRPRPKRPRPRGISLLELTNETCRFPHGDPGEPGFFFCGAPDADLEGGKPYCAQHARRAYNGAARAACDDDSPVIPLRNAPSIAPFDSSRLHLWRAAVKHPAPRWK